jgi:hypothetical protein
VCSMCAIYLAECGCGCAMASRAKVPVYQMHNCQPVQMSRRSKRQRLC